jgi:hypothetical protein
MPTPTYTALATVTLGSSASSVTFSSIPATYRDLVLVHAGTSSNGSLNSLLLRFNGDSGSNYTLVYMEGNGSSANSGTGSGTGVNAGFTVSSPVSNNITQIMDYSATDKHKTVLSRKNTSSSNANAQASRWANTAAITSIVCTVDSGATFSTGSTFNLYGIAS